jgi:alcohol dehydrogenase
MGLMFSFQLPTRVEFGQGVSKRIGPIAKEMGSKRVLIVTDGGIKESGILDTIRQVVEAEGLQVLVFSEVEANPTDVTTERGAVLAKEWKSDLIVGLGGGSSMDAAKGISVLMTNPGSIRSYNGPGKVKNHTMPLLTVPTTSGTGSEANYWSIITDTNLKIKMSVGGPAVTAGGPCVAAKLALVDPLLTLSVPQRSTASCGIDAFSHAYGAYLAKPRQPFSDSLALMSMELIGNNLRRAYSDGSDVQARENMSVASCMAGIAFANSDCTAEHSLAEATGGYYPKVAHGVAIGIFLPHIMEFTCISEPERFRRIAQAMGEDISGLTARQAANKAIQAVRELIIDVGLPTTLKEVGVEKEGIKQIVSRAMINLSTPSNPRLISENDFLTVTTRAYE